MIRLTLLQSRTQTLVVLAMLAVMAIVVVPTGLHLTHLYNTAVVGCDARGDCNTAQQVFMRTFSLLHNSLNNLMLLVPAVIGIFFGAPLLAREFEAGTFRLAWTQGVSRKRWIVVKLVAVVLAGMIAAGLLSLMVTWWSSPFGEIDQHRFNPGNFDIQGLVPIGYAAFAVAVGAVAGLATRRMLPAMAITVALFIGVRIAIALWVLPHVMAPVHLDVALQDAAGLGIVQHSDSPDGVTFVAEAPAMPNAWIISSAIVDAAGVPATDDQLHAFLVANCPDIVNQSQQSGTSGITSGTSGPVKAPEAVQQAFGQCVQQLSTTYHLAVTYQPANRYWPFQWIDLAIFVGFSCALAGFGYWWLRRRVA